MKIKMFDRISEYENIIELIFLYLGFQYYNNLRRCNRRMLEIFNSQHFGQNSLLLAFRCLGIISNSHQRHLNISYTSDMLLILLRRIVSWPISGINDGRKDTVADNSLAMIDWTNLVPIEKYVYLGNYHFPCLVSNSNIISWPTGSISNSSAPFTVYQQQPFKLNENFSSRVELTCIAYFELCYKHENYVKQSLSNSNVIGSSGITNNIDFAIGLATSLAPLRLQEIVAMGGWNGIAYHRDGRCFQSGKVIKGVLGPQYNIGDIIGCGIVYPPLGSNSYGQLFFTKNSQIAFTLDLGFNGFYHLPWFPIIYVSSLQMDVDFNFGIEDAFNFDVKEYERLLIKNIKGFDDVQAYYKYIFKQQDEKIYSNNSTVSRNRNSSKVSFSTVNFPSRAKLPSEANTSEANTLEMLPNTSVSLHDQSSMWHPALLLPYSDSSDIAMREQLSTAATTSDCSDQLSNGNGSSGDGDIDGDDIDRMVSLEHIGRCANNFDGLSSSKRRKQYDSVQSLDSLWNNNPVSWHGDYDDNKMLSNKLVSVTSNNNVSTTSSSSSSSYQDVQTSKSTFHNEQARILPHKRRVFPLNHDTKIVSMNYKSDTLQPNQLQNSLNYLDAMQFQYNGKYNSGFLDTSSLLSNLNNMDDSSIGSGKGFNNLSTFQVENTNTLLPELHSRNQFLQPQSHNTVQNGKFSEIHSFTNSSLSISGGSLHKGVSTLGSTDPSNPYINTFSTSLSNPSYRSISPTSVNSTTLSKVNINSSLQSHMQSQIQFHIQSHANRIIVDDMDEVMSVATSLMVEVASVDEDGLYVGYGGPSDEDDIPDDILEFEDSAVHMFGSGSSPISNHTATLRHSPIIAVDSAESENLASGASYANSLLLTNDGSNLPHARLSSGSSSATSSVSSYSFRDEIHYVPGSVDEWSLYGYDGGSERCKEEAHSEDDVEDVDVDGCCDDLATVSGGGIIMDIDTNREGTFDQDYIDIDQNASVNTGNISLSASQCSGSSVVSSIDKFYLKPKFSIRKRSSSSGGKSTSSNHSTHHSFPVVNSTQSSNSANANLSAAPKQPVVELSHAVNNLSNNVINSNNSSTVGFSLGMNDSFGIRSPSENCYPPLLSNTHQIELNNIIGISPRSHRNSVSSNNSINSSNGTGGSAGSLPSLGSTTVTGTQPTERTGKLRNYHQHQYYQMRKREKRKADISR